MTLLYVVLAVLCLALAITVVALWYYLGKPHPILAKLLSPIFILFLVWTAFGFPTHFDTVMDNFYFEPDFDNWCDCGNGNCTELAERIGNSSYNDFYKDLCFDRCCKGNFTIEETADGKATLPNPIID